MTLAPTGFKAVARTAKKSTLSATPVFKLTLKPNQEVPPIKGLKADAVGSVTSTSNARR